MAFDPLNPFAQLDPFGPAPFTGAAGRLPSQQPPPLPPEEEKSLLEKIGGAASGGLNFVAGILNKPGRVVRGLLGGKPREALNAIPFSDALGITNPEDQVHGQDLLGAKDAAFFSPEGLAGFGVDVLTDPLTYMSFGGHALTKLGQAGSKVKGLLPATGAARAAGVVGSDAYKLAQAADAAGYAANPIFAAADVAGKPLGGHVGFGLPFGGNAATFNLAPAGNAVANGLQGAIQALPGGQTALDALSGAGSALGRLYTRSVPSLFEAAVKGRQTGAGQDIARAITEGSPEAQALANAKYIPMAQLAEKTGLGNMEGSNLLSRYVETGQGMHPMQFGWNPEKEQAVQTIGDFIKNDFASQLPEATAAGLPNQELSKQLIRSGPGEGQELGYLHRQSTPLDQTVGQFFKKGSATPSKAFARENFTTGLTKEQLNELAQVPQQALAVSGSTLPYEGQAAQTIGEKYLGVPKAQADVAKLQAAVAQAPNDAHLADQLTRAQAIQATLESQAKDLAGMKASNDMPQFLNHTIADAAKKSAEHQMNLLSAAETYNGLAKVATTAKGVDDVPIMDALSGLWQTTETASGAGAAPQGAQLQMAKALGVNVADLSKYSVPREVAKDIAGLSRSGGIAGLEDFTKLWDTATNLTKAGQTMFPGTVTRNIVQDMFNKMVYGAHYGDMSKANPMAYLQPVRDWMQIANGGTVNGLAKKLSATPGFQGLNDIQAADEVRRLATAYDVTHQAFKKTTAGMVDVGGNPVGKTLDTLLPGAGQQNPLQAYIGGLKEGDLNPIGVAGAFGKTSNTFKPVLAAKSAQGANDAMQRGSSFLAFLSKGYEPAEAIKQVVKTHYDFANLSQFERTVMKRVLPFYSWARQNIPAVVSEIATNPGGLEATAVKATAAMKGEHPGFLPPYISEGAAAPIGPEQDGQQRYLTRLGLGFEDLGSLTGPGGPLGMLNPLIKAPIEQLTGKQLFTGRDLRDLHSRVGDLTGTPLSVGENLLMNSPIGRTVDVASTLVDQRKGLPEKILNTLSGFRISDVDLGQARQTAVRDYIREALHGPGIRHFDELSVRPDNLPLLSPEELQLYRLYRGLNKR